MKFQRTLPFSFALPLVLAAVIATVLITASSSRTTQAQSTPTAKPPAVLVELFTSEGCSSCPPADTLLQQVSGHLNPQGQLVIGLSEHVSYWNGLGWKDPFSADIYTSRQNNYSARLRGDGVYTPEMIVNGREAFVGSDQHALDAAFATEAHRPAINLHITAAQLGPRTFQFSYQAGPLPAKNTLQLVAVLVDDADDSHVLRGENSGRRLVHVSVARAFAELGPLHHTDSTTVTLPLPAAFMPAPGTGHHLVLFAEEGKAGPIAGVDTSPL